MAATFLLDRSAWDTCLDVYGNIAVATEPYSIIQDVASACRVVLGECYFDTTRGLPYFTQILGKRPPLSLVKFQLEKAALTVPLVATAKAFLTSVGRTLSGQVQVTTTTGLRLVAQL